MIIDKISNGHLYNNISESIAKALEILQDKQITQKEDGRYEVDGDNLFYMIQRYKTMPLEEGRLEAHKKYIDVQFIAQGQELIGHCNIDNLKVEQPYDPDGDVVFYEVPEKINTVILTAGSFCILYPHDNHMPSRQVDGPSEVLKIVVKVKADA